MSDDARSRAALPVPPRVLVAVWLVAVIVRVAAFAAIGPTQLVGDENHYLATAAAMARGEGHWNPRLRTAAQWPPAQAAFLFPFVDRSATAVAGDVPAPRAAVIAEIVVGSVVPVATCLLGAALFGVSAGVGAGVIAALHPELVAYSLFLWSENLFTALITAATAIAVVGGSPTRRRAVLAGLLFGFAILTREEGAFVAIAVFAAWGSSRAPWVEVRRRIALAVVAMVVVVTPWSIRNTQLLGRFVPVSTVGWMGAAEGNLLGPSWLRREAGAAREWRQRYFAIDGDVARMDFARATALDSIGAAQPAWLPQKLALNLPRLWSPDSFLFRKLAVRTAGPPALGWQRAALVTQVVVHVTVVGLAFCMLIRDGERRRRWLGVGVLGSITLLHVLANASSRYRLPLVPFLSVYAAGNLASGLPRLRELTRRQRIGALVLGAALVLCVASFAPKARQLWTQGATPAAASAE